MNVLKNAKIWHKLILVVLMLIAPLTIAVYLLVDYQNSNITFTTKEIHGIEYVLPVQHLAANFAKHREITTSILEGNEGMKSQLVPVINAIDNNIAELEELNKSFGKELKTTDKWVAIKQKWGSLKLSYSGMEAKKNFSSHSDLVADVLALSTHIGSTSNLILDPDLESNYLMELIIKELPYLAEDLSKARGAGTAEAIRGHMTYKELLFMAKEVQQVDSLFKKSVVSLSSALQNYPSLKPELGNYESQLIQNVSEFLDLTKKEFLNGETTISVSPDKYYNTATKAISTVQALADATGPVFIELLKTRVDSLSETRNWEIGFVSVFILLSLGIGYLVISNLVNGISTAVSVASAIADDNLDSDITVKSKDETGQLLSAFKDMQTKLKTRIESDKKVAAENGRVKQALDAVKTNVMVADENNDIVYMNDALISMFENAGNDIRKDLPGFNEKNLMGGNMDQFHKNPSHQRNLVGSLKETLSTEISVGGRTFSLVATPVFNDSDERLGTAVEWGDRTLEIQIEREVEEVVVSAASGDLGKRLSIEGKSGFFRNVSEGINQLAGVCDDVIQDTIRVFGAMAEGNLTEKISNEYQGSFEQLKKDANSTIDKFVEVVDEIQNTATSVTTGASEISTGNQSLSQRNEEQASSLEETASSMEEMTSTVRQNADNANQANQLATAARNQAEKGGEVVGTAVNAMSEINTSSKKVADIISVIDEIAFQTNLLALNAAVEAARAGEQGRGFAVVASEVRNLAQRSAGAAKEIKDLIEESVTKVDEGTELVNASGETLEEIVNGIKKVSDIVAEIAAASAEQASGIDQVNKAITQLDDMTQQNAALVEEAAAASEAMQGQSEGLSELMTFFSTGNERHASKIRTKPRIEVTKRADSTVNKTVASGQVKPKAIPDDEEWEEF